MDNKEMANIPFFAHEYECARLERIIKRLIVIIFILVCLVGYCVYELTCYDYSEVTVDSQDGGNANYMGAGASGVINNGESRSQE